MRHLSVGLALFAAGCVQPTSNSSPFRSDVEAYDSRTPDDPEGEFEVHINDGAGERRVPVVHLGRHEVRQPVPTQSKGILRVSVRLIRDGQPIATQSIELPLKPDWGYDIDLHATSKNPLDGCFGCMGIRSSPIAGESGPNAAKLHVVWGGNSISAPVAY